MKWDNGASILASSWFLVYRGSVKQAVSAERFRFPVAHLRIMIWLAHLRDTCSCLRSRSACADQTSMPSWSCAVDLDQWRVSRLLSILDQDCRVFVIRIKPTALHSC